MKEDEKVEQECDCGCEDESDVIMLEDEEGNQYPYYHVATIEYEGKEYACLEEADENVEEPQIEFFELEEVEGDDGYYNLLPVDDELYEILEHKLAELVEEQGDECDDPDCDCHHHND